VGGVKSTSPGFCERRKGKKDLQDDRKKGIEESKKSLKGLLCSGEGEASLPPITKKEDKASSRGRLGGRYIGGARLLANFKTYAENNKGTRRNKGTLQGHTT